MNLEEGFVVEGYRFYLKNEAETASRELARIKVLDEKLDAENYDAVKALYLKALNQQVFETQIGFDYLRNIQRYLISKKVLKPEENPIPVFYSKMTQEEEVLHMKEEYQAFKKELREETVKQIDKEKEMTDKARSKCRTFMILTGVLAVMVVGMFLISMTGKNENILNYKNVIINRYAEWEQDLTEREAVIRQKEAELEITP